MEEDTDFNNPDEAEENTYEDSSEILQEAMEDFRCCSSH